MRPGLAQAEKSANNYQDQNQELRGSVSALNGLCADMNFPKSLDDVGTSIILHNSFRTLLKSYLIFSTSCGFIK